MNLFEYGEAAATTAIYKGRGTFDGLLYCTSELVGELGESFNIVKKIQREGWSEKYKDKLIGEFGGVSWAFSQIYYELRIERYLKELPDTDGDNIPDLNTLLPFKDKHLVNSKCDPRVLVLNAVLGVCMEFASVLHGKVVDGTRITNITDKLDEFQQAINSLCIFLGFSFDEVLKKNLELLSARKEAGTLTGSGDGVEGRDE